jgi:hypothetical protein
MVIAPANTGNDRSNKTAVIITDQTKRGIESKFIEDDRMFKMVVIKLIAPKIEEAPARCNLKITMSIDTPEWNILFAKGG